MPVGMPVGTILGRLISPFLAWRPVRAVHLIAPPLVVLFGVAGFTMLPKHWVTSRASDRNGVIGRIINVALCALAGNGVLTWARNRRLP